LTRSHLSWGVGPTEMASAARDSYVSGRRCPATLSIQLPDDAERRLRDAANRLQVPVADLAAAAVRDFITAPAEDFDRAARLVLEKNAELYRRLA
jgi:hypothetical protein